MIIKNKLVTSERDKKLLIIVLLMLVVFILYQYIYVASEKEKDKLQAEKDTVSEEHDRLYGQAEKLSNLEQEIETLKSSILFNADNFYGSAEQEEFLYFIDSLLDISGLKMKSIVCNKSGGATLNRFVNNSEDVLMKIEAKENQEENNNQESESDEETEAKKDESSGGAIVKEEVQKEEETVDFNIINITMQLEGKFKNYKKLLSLIDKNKERIVVPSITLTDGSNIMLILGNSLNPEEREVYSPSVDEFENMTDEQKKAFNNLNPESKKIVKDALEENKLLTCDIMLQFYSFPSVDRYIERKEFNTWEMKSSRENPYEKVGLLNPVLIRTKIHEFKDSSYNLTTQNPKDFAEVVTDEENGKIFTKINYSFDKDSENPKIIMDLSKLNLKIGTKIEEIGVSFYSGDINNSKLSVIIEDKNKKEHLITIADEFYFKGWASITKKLGDVPYPITVKKLIISQTGKGEELKGGYINLNHIYCTLKSKPKTTS